MATDPPPRQDTVDTLILRFRDLATTPGDTIKLHSDIAAGGAVWWGWWHKSGETVPLEVFRQLCERMQTGPVELLLFDSGHLKIRRASCTAIRWDSQLRRIPSPDQANTPAYYNQQQYLAWFCFEKFHNEEIDTNAFLRNYTYHRIDAFFQNGRSRYSEFYDKRVYDCDELRQQDRSIWFLRRFKNGDPTHKVSLLGAKTVAPFHFSEEYTAAKSQNLLWLSDLHFGEHHAFPTGSNIVKRDLGQAIDDAARHHNILDFGAVIISGDLTWKASRTEFDDALTCVRRLSRSPTTLDNYRFAICPGNHDLRFTPTPEKSDTAIHEAETSETARAEYARFYEALYYSGPNEFLSLGRRLLLGGCIPTEIVCLNSSMLEQKAGWFQGHGFVGENQLRHVEKSFGWDSTLSDKPRPLRIVVMHHHLIPVTYSEQPKGGSAYSVVLDAERVARWLCKHRVDLVLHGHMHQSFCARISRPVNISEPGQEWHSFYVLGMGSSGVARDHRKQDNMFGVLTVHQQKVSAAVYTLFPGDEQSSVVWSLDIPVIRELP